jgi:hypothetical protein
MDTASWANVFESARQEPGASEEQIRGLLGSIARPPGKQELDRARSFFRRNPFPPGDPLHDRYVPPDPGKWVMPFRGLPESYLAFLRWSNGGTFRNGKREIEFWPCAGPRGMMETYYFPQFAPLVVPFAGSPRHGDWYGFDTGAEPVAGEFPVVYIPHESMGERMVLAPTFLAFCRDTEDPERLYWDWWRRKQGLR